MSMFQLALLALAVQPTLVVESEGRCAHSVGSQAEARWSTQPKPGFGGESILVGLKRNEVRMTPMTAIDGVSAAVRISFASPSL